MSFFGGGGGFNDPFFGDMHQRMFHQMREMDNLMSSMMADPFAMMDGRGLEERRRLAGPENSARSRMIDDGRGHHQASSSARNQDQQQQQVVDRRRGGGGVFGGFFDDEDDDMGMMMPFGRRGMPGGGLMGGLMNQMDQMRNQALNDPNSHVYSHSTVMSYDGMGHEPRYYEATNSMRKAGDVKEERRTVRDSRAGVDKMKISHQVGDKAHSIEKKRGKDGKIVENQEFKNLTEEEARDFDRHFGDRARARGRIAGRIEQGPIVEEAEDPPFAEPTSSEGQAFNQHRRRTNDRRHAGPRIEEVDDDDVAVRNESQATTDGSDRKRRRGLFGKKLFDA